MSHYSISQYLHPLHLPLPRSSLPPHSVPSPELLPLYLCDSGSPRKTFSRLLLLQPPSPLPPLSPPPSPLLSPPPQDQLVACLPHLHLPRENSSLLHSMLITEFTPSEAIGGDHWCRAAARLLNTDHAPSISTIRKSRQRNSSSSESLIRGRTSSALGMTSGDVT